VAELLKPARGGFLRVIGCGQFVKEFLLGRGPLGSPVIDAEVGAPQADIFFYEVFRYQPRLYLTN
jgi:hypothetical protein